MHNFNPEKFLKPGPTLKNLKPIFCKNLVFPSSNPKWPIDMGPTFRPTSKLLQSAIRNLKTWKTTWSVSVLASLQLSLQERWIPLTEIDVIVSKYHQHQHQQQHLVTCSPSAHLAFVLLTLVSAAAIRWTAFQLGLLRALDYQRVLDWLDYETVHSAVIPVPRIRRGENGYWLSVTNTCINK